MSIGLVTCGVRNESDPALALLSEHINDTKVCLRVAAIVGCVVFFEKLMFISDLDSLMQALAVKKLWTCCCPWCQTRP